MKAGLALILHLSSGFVTNQWCSWR